MSGRQLPEEAKRLAVYHGSRRVILWGETEAGGRLAEKFLETEVNDDEFAHLEALWEGLADTPVFHNTVAYKPLTDLGLREFKYGRVRILAKEHRHYVILLRGSFKDAQKLPKHELESAQKMGKRMADWLDSLEAKR